MASQVDHLSVRGVLPDRSNSIHQLARQPYYRWRANPITEAERVGAYRANALFDAHRDDLEFGYRYLLEEARTAGGSHDQNLWMALGLVTWRGCTFPRMI